MIDVCKILTGESTVDEITNEFCNEINTQIRKELNNILSSTPTPRDLEIKKILEDEKRKYELDKAEFESNPLHWSNNKRRWRGLPVLRGKSNKNRQTKFRSFRPTPRMFFAIEDIIDETIENKFKDGEFFNQFVDIKNLSLGDKKVFRACKEK